jgi:hypothetical protein
MKNREWQPGKRLPICGLGLAFVLSVSCTRTSSDSSSDIVAAVTLATLSSCNMAVPCKLVARYPSGVRTDRIATVARDGIAIASQAEIKGPSGLLAVAATETGQARVEAQAHAGGIWTTGSAFVGGQAVVDGTLAVGGALEVQAGATVGARVVPQGLPGQALFTVTFPNAAGAQDITLQNSASQTLAPGRYGQLVVNNGSTVSLATGVYYFERIQLEPGSRVAIDNRAGTAVVLVRGELVSRGRWVSQGAPSDVLVGSFFRARVELGAAFEGTVIAPDADLVLDRTPTPHKGAFFARTISVQSGAHVEATNVTGIGPAWASLDGAWQPATGVTPPTPPASTGKTFEQYEADLSTFLSGLIATGYRGPAVEVPAHPDMAKVPLASEFKLPTTEAAAHGVTIVQEPAAAVPARSTDETQHAAEANAQLVADLQRGETRTFHELPFTNTGDPSQATTFGRGLRPPPSFPKHCVLANRDIPTDAEVKQLQDEFGSPFVKELHFGRRPAYINLAAFPEDSNRVTGALPLVDAFWFVEGSLISGFAADRGLFGEIDGQIAVGGVMLHHAIRILDARFFAEADSADTRNDRGRNPYVAARLGTFVIDFVPFQFDKTLDNTKREELFKQNLLDGTFTLLPGGGITFPVGPFSVEVNGGVQVSAPLALNIDITGPEATFAPMARAFVMVFGGIDAGIKVGLEGQVDLLRVDAPFNAKLKWHNRLNPDECAASADFKATLSMDFSTLNGTLNVVAGISDSLVPGLLYRHELFTWTGIHLTSDKEIDLIDQPIKVLKYPAALCTLGPKTCADTATANTVLSDFATTHTAVTTVNTTDYGQNACPGQYLVEVPLAGYSASDIWIRARWQLEDVATADQCNDSHSRVDVWELLQDPNDADAPAIWQLAYSFSAAGALTPDGCVATASGAQLPDGQTQLFNNPWSWLPRSCVSGRTCEAANAGWTVTKVRLAIGSEIGCEPKHLTLTLNDHRF